MKLVGHEVLFLKTSENNPRNGESTFTRLADDRILLAYTEYYSPCGEDHGTARICCCVSADEGDTWSAPRIMIEKDEDAQNIMSPSLVTMADGTVGLFYLRKQFMEDGGLTCMPCFRRSSDNAETWSDECRCPIPSGYYCGINDGAIVTRAGHLLWPVSHHGERYFVNGGGLTKPVNEMQVLSSEDGGETWSILPGIVRSPFASTSGSLAEPGIYEQEDGTLWMWMRTGLGHQYDTLSHDGGKTWLPLEPNLRFTSPDSPMRVKPIGNGMTAAVFNPVPFHCVSTGMELWSSPKRTPIVCSISKDDAVSLNKRGVSFVNGGMREFVCNTYLLETDETNSYCYPAILGVKNGLLVSYYHSDNTPACLNASKVVKISFDELD